MEVGQGVFCAVFLIPEEQVTYHFGVKTNTQLAGDQPEKVMVALDTV